MLLFANTLYNFKSSVDLIVKWVNSHIFKNNVTIVLRCLCRINHLLNCYNEVNLFFSRLGICMYPIYVRPIVWTSCKSIIQNNNSKYPLNRCIIKLQKFTKNSWVLYQCIAIVYFFNASAMVLPISAGDCTT